MITLKKINCFIIASGICLTSFSQVKSSYFDSNWNKVGKSDSSLTFKRDLIEENEKFSVTEFYTSNNTIYSKGIYSDKKLKLKTGKFEYFHENGTNLKVEQYNTKGELEGNVKSFYYDSKLESDVNYISGKMNGECKWYHPNGQLASKEIYITGKLTQIEFWDENGVVEKAKLGDETIAPTFANSKEEGVQKYMYSKIIFPEAARYNSDGGRVLLNFTISKNGEVADVKIELGEDIILDQEALRVAKLVPAWTPGKKHNRDAKFENILIPIFFNLVLSRNEAVKYSDK